VRSYAPLPSDRSFVKFSDLFAAPLPSPQYPTRFVELISVLDELLIRVQVSIKNLRTMFASAHWTFNVSHAIRCFLITNKILNYICVYIFCRDHHVLGSKTKEEEKIFFTLLII